MKKKEIHKRIQKIRQEDKEVRFQGLLDKITDYLQNPSEEKREKLRLFVQVAVSPEELLGFFLDNLKTLDNIST